MLARLCALTPFGSAPYHSHSIDALHGAPSGMADPSDNHESIDPLTVGELITLEGAAEYSQLSKHSLSTYIRKGRLKAKKMGNLWVTTKAAVDAYLASRDFESIPHRHRNTP